MFSGHPGDRRWGGLGVDKPLATHTPSISTSYTHSQGRRKMGFQPEMPPCPSTKSSGSWPTAQFHIRAQTLETQVP